MEFEVCAIGKALRPVYTDPVTYNEFEAQLCFNDVENGCHPSQ